MKKELASIAIAVTLACNTIPPLIDTLEIPTSTLEPTPIIEPLERKLIGVKYMTNGKLIVIGLAYDLNNDDIPDVFEAYFGHYNPDTNWMHLHELIGTTYKDKTEDL